METILPRFDMNWPCMPGHVRGLPLITQNDTLSAAESRKYVHNRGEQHGCPSTVLGRNCRVTNAHAAHTDAPLHVEQAVYLQHTGENIHVI